MNLPLGVMMSHTKTRLWETGPHHRRMNSHEHRIRSVEEILPTLATKSDLKELGLMTKADINAFRLATTADISEFRHEFKADINELRHSSQADNDKLRSLMETRFEQVMAQMYKFDASSKTWMVGTLISLFVCFSGLVVAMNTNGKRDALASPTQAISSNAPASSTSS